MVANESAVVGVVVAQQENGDTTYPDDRSDVRIYVAGAPVKVDLAGLDPTECPVLCKVQLLGTCTVL